MGRTRGTWWRRALVLAPVVLMAPALPVTGGASTATVATRPAPGPEIIVHQPTRASIPTGFVGLTFEATTLGSAYLDPAQSNLPSLLALLGPGNLRFGGQTSELDAAWLDPPTTPLPSWATTGLTPAELTTVGALARASGWSVDLGVNLLHFDPAAAADEVQTAEAQIGSSLRAVEIGNEPDLYFYFLSFLGSQPGGVPTTFPAYLADWDAYVTAIRAVAPTVQINGPDFYLTDWLADVTRKSDAPLGDFTQHFYPQLDCGGAVVPPSQLLEPASFSTEASLIAEARTAARRGGHPLVLDEFNSISCGSSSPAAYEFASSLWVVHALLEAAADGVASVNVQMDPGNCDSYSPLCVPDPSAPATLETRPIFQGMQLVSGLEGGTFLTAKSGRTDPLPAAVSEYAVRTPGGDVAVVVDNTGDAPVDGLSLKLDPTATVEGTETLSAPSLTSETGVTLTSAASSSPPTGLTVPADSAVVFTLAP